MNIAERFLVQVERSFSDLGRHPDMGMELELSRPELAGMRKWHVKGFEKYLIFCRLGPTGVSVVRILHASQDWWGVLGIIQG